MNDKANNMTSTGTAGCKDLLLSMPPMDDKDFQLLKMEVVSKLLPKQPVGGNKRLEDTNNNNIESSVTEEMHLRQCCYQPASSDLVVVEGTTGALAKGLHQQLRKYQKEHYEASCKKDDKVTARYTIQQQQQQQQKHPNESEDATPGTLLVIRTYAQVIDTHRSRTGYWSGVWTITPPSVAKDANDTATSSSSVTASIAGEIKVHVHHYEAGANVQLRAQRNMETATIIAGHDNDDLCRKLKNHMAEAEKNLQQALTNQDRYQASLKKMRRILPVTKTRMKWDDAAQNQVRLLNLRSSQKN